MPVCALARWTHRSRHLSSRSMSGFFRSMCASCSIAATKSSAEPPYAPVRLVRTANAQPVVPRDGHVAAVRRPDSATWHVRRNAVYMRMLHWLAAACRMSHARCARHDYAVHVARCVSTALAHARGTLQLLDRLGPAARVLEAVVQRPCAYSRMRGYWAAAGTPLPALPRVPPARTRMRRRGAGAREHEWPMRCRMRRKRPWRPM